MQGDKRKDHRKSLKYPARIDLGDGNPPVPCLLVDVSESGAKVMVESHDDLPECFTLLLAGEGGRQRRCKLVWQEGNHFGAIFVKAPAVRDDAPARPGFRELMRRD
jgi:hypothetical protein